VVEKTEKLTRFFELETCNSFVPKKKNLLGAGSPLVSITEIGEETKNPVGVDCRSNIF
jgi:hypothetical protein